MSKKAESFYSNLKIKSGGAFKSIITKSDIIGTPVIIEAKKITFSLDGRSLLSPKKKSETVFKR